MRDISSMEYVFNFGSEGLPAANASPSSIPASSSEPSPPPASTSSSISFMQAKRSSTSSPPPSRPETLHKSPMATSAVDFAAPASARLFLFLPVLPIFVFYFWVKPSLDLLVKFAATSKSVCPSSGRDGRCVVGPALATGTVA